jgi:miniconductance mechanosensitive channel
MTHDSTLIGWTAQQITTLGISQEPAFWLAIASLILGLVVISWLANYVAKHYLLAFIHKLLKKNGSIWTQAILNNKVFHRLSHIAPAIVIYYAILIFETQNSAAQSLIQAIKTATVVYMIIIVTLVINLLLSTIDQAYRHFEIAKKRPIKSYIQVAKLALFILAGIIAISIVINKSPLVLLTGLGALSAVTLIVFRDSILGFVASIQLTSYDMVRIGDWIEIPSFGVDGDVVDMSLNTIKVQNFDKTIVTVPSYSLLTQGVKNWRGMSESGGRRIKRSINIDVNSIKFCDQALLDKLRKIHTLADYIKKKNTEVLEHNQNLKVDTTISANGRRLTNIGTFRAYLDAYLKQHPKIHQGLTFLIRQLQPTPTGLPIEIYVFTNDTDWGNYEAIQADIFDHIFAVLPEFGLQAFQEPCGQRWQVELVDPELANQVIQSASASSGKAVNKSATKP